jgi:serine kinase of HPr protein (carbohydrate metabolism regulator)
VAFNKKGLLLLGPSGVGKSDLAFRIIGDGGILISDDRTILTVDEYGEILASPPDSIKGKIEIRGLGIIDKPFVKRQPIHLVVSLQQSPVDIERLPTRSFYTLFDQNLPLVNLWPFSASAVAFVTTALDIFSDS